MPRPLTVAFLAVLLLPGCATRSDTDRLEARIADVEVQVAGLSLSGGDLEERVAVLEQSPTFASIAACTKRAEKVDVLADTLAPAVATLNLVATGRAQGNWRSSVQRHWESVVEWLPNLELAIEQFTSNCAREYQAEEVRLGRPFNDYNQIAETAAALLLLCEDEFAPHGADCDSGP